MQDINPYAEIHVEAGISSPSDFNKILGDIEEAQSFDDINFVSGRLLAVKSNGKVFRVGKRKLKTSEVEYLATLIGRGSNVPSDIRSGNQLDPSYQFTYKERLTFRYRVNVSAIRGDFGQDLKITLRSIKSEIPSLDYARISETDFDFILDGAGLLILSGETGSGKTTSIAAIIGHLIRNSVGKNLHRIVCCYEQPSEYMYQSLVDNVYKETGCNVEVYQHEIGLDLKDFVEGTRNAFRSNPDIILLGEARDLPTIKAALMLAQSGHMVMITTHAKGAINTISRLVSSFTEDEQGAALQGFLTSTKMIISQELIRSLDGGRVPIREFVSISNKAQRDFGVENPKNLMAAFGKYFSENGTTFMEHGRKLYSDGDISQTIYENIMLRESKNEG